jgi:hypothetical protein
MLRDLARQRATLWYAVNEAINNSTDGGPRAQRRMAARIEQAGAHHVRLTPGKRGRYELTFHDFTGWDAERDAEISVGDEVPEKPWISCNLTFLSSPGRGRETLEHKSVSALLITHHALSRAAQRLGLRTADHLMVAARVIWNGTAGFVKENREKASLNSPPEGWRISIGPDGDATAVLQRNDQHHRLLVATTVF